MRILQGFDNLPRFKNPIVTVGSYDGVHAGHRVLLGRIVEQARAQNCESVVITFSPHPRTVLDPNARQIPLLNSLKEKTLLLEQIGIDNLIIAPFTREFSMVSSYDFVHDYLIGRLGVGTLVVGYNHHFGHNKEGNFNFLYSLQDRFSFNISEVPRQQVDNDKVSSTVVRRQIEHGQMAQAAQSLTQPYFIICRADSCGRILPDEPNKLLPPDGIYSVQVTRMNTDIEIVTRITAEASESVITQLKICANQVQLTPPLQISDEVDFIVKFL